MKSWDVMTLEERVEWVQRQFGETTLITDDKTQHFAFTKLYHLITQLWERVGELEDKLEASDNYKAFCELQAENDALKQSNNEWHKLCNSWLIFIQTLNTKHDALKAEIRKLKSELDNP
jgi:hypothetical protein